MPILKDFKKFIARGNAVDMAVGIILGASFTKIVDVLVNNVLMPPIGVFLGGVDFSSFKITLKNGSEINPPVTIDYGLFINTIINFIIVGFSVFILIKLLGVVYRRKEAAPNFKTCPECKMEIPLEARKCGHCTTVLQ